MYSHLNTTTVPFYTDANWTPIFIETSISAGVITGDTVSIPTIINFPYTTSRFLLIEAKNDGSLGNPSYTEIRELKLFDNNSNTPAPIDSMQTPIFTQVTAICEGDALNTLPATSNNGIIGSWSPALNTTATTEYTFLPSSGQCAETATMIIIVTPTSTEPTIECWETNIWNATTCSWITSGTQPTEPTNIECWETNTWDATTCSWITSGTQPTEPTNIECWETNTWDATTCSWITNGTQPIEPTNNECWETNTWDATTCSWITNGTQPQADVIQNVIECESYTLQNISNGNYFTTPNGTGSPLFEGDIITTTQTIYIYAEANTTSNCFAESSFTITINPSQDFTLTQANLDIEEDEITVTMFDPSIDYEYSIDGFNYQNNNYFSGFTDGNYTLYVRDINGCIENTVDFTIEIKQFLIPKYFTPNGDNVHENWDIIDNKNEIKLTSIFNRYGKLLTQLKATKRWDGKFKGRLMPTSDYWYVIELKDGTLLKGHFSLVR